MCVCVCVCACVCVFNGTNVRMVICAKFINNLRVSILHSPTVLALKHAQGKARSTTAQLTQTMR